MQKLDRTSIVVIVLCIASFAGWQWYMNKNYPQRPQGTSETLAQTTDEASPTPAITPEATPVPTPPVAAFPIETSQEESIHTQSAEYVFSNDSGGLDEVILNTHFGEEDQPIRLNADRALPVGAVGFSGTETLRGFAMSVSPDNQVVFTHTTPDGLEIIKRFTVPEEAAENYLLDLDITFRNAGDREVSRQKWFLTTGAAAPVHSTDMPIYTRFEWAREGKMRTTDVNWFSASSVPLLGIPWRDARSLYEEKTDKISWAGTSSQYFCILVTSPDKEGTEVWAKRFDWTVSEGKPVYGIEGGLGFDGFTLAPGATHSVKLTVYAGPKEYSLLKSLGGDQELAMNFGIFKPVSVFLLWSMNKLYGVFGSYAIAIIALTILIKSALWPLQNKATQSMKKMSVLSPKITELREKYKDDPQKMNQEMMKLYREYGINPFGGCLPILIQIPIFFGFYSMLGTAIELRNSSFLWVNDLSQPDTVFHVLQFPINVLPLLMAGTMVWQMAISPKSGDAMQQRIMLFMPIIFVVFAYNFASALSLYWTTQNLFSIVQLYLTRDKPAPKLEKRSDALKRATAQSKKQKRSKRKPA